MWRLRPKRKCPELRDLLKSLSSGAHRDANLIKQRQWTCKPNSVFRLRGMMAIPLGAALLRRSCDLPGGADAPSRCVPAKADSLPIWSCSVWGLPCPEHCYSGGALLTHLFTLTTPPRRRAVCFLWHWPSSSLNAGIPDVIRHTALRSSDFPPRRAGATIRSTCLSSDYS